MIKNNSRSLSTLLIEGEKPVLNITINRWGIIFGFLLGLILVGLGSVTLYSFIDNQSSSNSNRGTDLAYLNSANLREQEQKKLIELGEARLKALQNDNNLRKQDFDRLQNEIVVLSGNLNSFQQLTQKIDQRLATTSNATSPGKTNPSQGSLVGGESFDLEKGRAYSAQFATVSSELETLNKSIQNGRYNIAALEIQLQSFQTALNQPQTSPPLPMQLPNDQVAQLSGNPVNKTATGSNTPPAGSTAVAGKNQVLATGNDPPVTVPVNGVVTSLFGIRPSPFVAGTQNMHYGLDLAVPEGTPVAVTKAGVVTHVGYDSGYGNRVDVTHQGGWLTLYGHNSRILVKEGQIVQQGDIIALSGNTGASTGPHVHYEIHQNGLAFDPLKVVKVPLTYQAGL